MEKVRAKKKLGQHFLKDLNIAEKVADLVPYPTQNQILEIGPGMGVLTQFLNQKFPNQLKIVDIDKESVAYLNVHYPDLGARGSILEGDFLREASSILQNEHQWFVVGNFPYNISSQILFKILENREQVEGFGGMFQKEVAERICSGPGTKVYGILSVLMQAYFELNYCFTVSEHVFDPPPKVKTGVISGKRYRTQLPSCSDSLFFEVVKTAFNQRRKTLNNSLRKFNVDTTALESLGFAKLRPENLHVSDFIKLTQWIQNNPHEPK
jgi:16S rRNA (adenine1518-N6/adenine1519-N6)-dimethyltransferase